MIIELIFESLRSDVDDSALPGFQYGGCLYLCITPFPLSQKGQPYQT